MNINDIYEFKKIQEQFNGHIVIPFSSVTKVGVSELREELLSRR
jgi:hypothetical protein